MMVVRADTLSLSNSTGFAVVVRTQIFDMVPIPRRSSKELPITPVQLSRRSESQAETSTLSQAACTAMPLEKRFEI